jgi:hypothetical protein
VQGKNGGFPLNKSLVMNPKTMGGKVMGKTNFNVNRLKTLSVLSAGFLLGIFMLYGCASRKPQIIVSTYSFNFEGELYRINSVSLGDKEQPFNQLVGKDFVAVDFAHDRIIDRIAAGNVSRDEAQRIYEYGIDTAAKENKLRQQKPVVNPYVDEDADFYYMIRSLRLIDKHRVSPRIMVIVDQKADGTLDEVLKGTVTVEEVQSLYSEVIEGGLKKRELIKVDDMILVKEK